MSRTRVLQDLKQNEAFWKLSAFLSLFMGESHENRSYFTTVSNEQNDVVLREK